MPAVSESQRRLFAIAEHHPGELHEKNKRLAKLSHQTLHDFAATPDNGLPTRVARKADGKAGVGGGMNPGVKPMTNTAFQQNESERSPADHPSMPSWMEKITVVKTPTALADGKWASKAFGNNKGGLHRATGTPAGKTIPSYRVTRAAHSQDSHVRHMAQAAINIDPSRYGK